MTGKPSIPAVVSSIITHNPAIYECFKQRLLNYHALATNIKAEVEKVAGRPTTINTIVVAITRFSETVGETKPQPFLILRDARITLTSDVVDVTIKCKKSELFQTVKRVAEISSNLNEAVHLFQLSNSIKLIADEGEYSSMIGPSLDKMFIASVTTQLSRLDIRLSPAVEMTPGFGFFLTELLYRQGISLRHTYIGEETVLILGRDDGPRAYEIMRQEIDRSRATHSNLTSDSRKRQS